MRMSKPRARRATWSMNALGALLLGSVFAQGAGAQALPVPDAGQLLRESQQQPRTLPALPQAATTAPLQDSGVKVAIQRVQVENASRFTLQELAPLFEDIKGQELSFSEMQAVADRVANFYRQHGLVARAILPEQGLSDGLLRVQVIEGRFGRVQIDVAPGQLHLPTALIRSMLERGQRPGEILDADQLERQTLIANEVPGVRVSAVLKPGKGRGETDIVAKLDRRPLFSAYGTVDNDDGRATGAIKVGAGVSMSSVMGYGEQVQLNGSVSEGKKYVNLGVDVPIGTSGLHGGVNASTMTYKLVGDFASTGAKGSADSFGATLSHSVYRSSIMNLYAKASFEHRHMVNDASSGQVSDKTTDSLTVGLSGDVTDNFGGGGANMAGVSLTGGKLDLSENKADLAADGAGPQRNGRYARLNVNAGRLQRLTEAGSLWVGGSAQMASKNLDSSEKFALGGSRGVRAYPSLEGTGDQGVQISVEYRHRVTDRLQLSTFCDYGRVTRDHTPNASTAGPNVVSLKGVGVGAEWRMGAAVVRGAVATRIGSNPAAINGLDSDGTRHTTRVWLSASVPFSS